MLRLLRLVLVLLADLDGDRDRRRLGLFLGRVVVVVRIVVVVRVVRIRLSFGLLLDTRGGSNGERKSVIAGLVAGRIEAWARLNIQQQPTPVQVSRC